MREQVVDDLTTEFPAINDSVTGRQNRYSYAIVMPGSGLHEFAVVKYDGATGERHVMSAGERRLPGEAVFVPAEGGTAEDDGYLLTLVSDLAANSSELLVLDARDFSASPVARVRLPRRVPSGIHGSWIPDAN